MPLPSSKHEFVAKAVEKELRRFGAEYMDDDYLDGCIMMWHDFAQRVDLSRTRKPGTWAAAAFYAYTNICFMYTTQEEAASIFKVNKHSIGSKYREIASLLDLKYLDGRYIPEDLDDDFPDDFLPDDFNIFLEEMTNQFGDMGGFSGNNGSLDPAQDLVYDGWEALYADPDLAKEFFEEALKLNPKLADAHNGLANTFLLRKDLDMALQHYDKAYELAREELGSESPDAYAWWGELETRPYMRAREGRASIHWGRGDIKKAISEFEALLHINPNDNQGVRFLIAPLYLLINDAKALPAFEHYYTQYPDDFGDPYISFSYGLALYESGQCEQAVQVWNKAILDNIYVAPLITDQPIPDPDISHTTNLQDLDYAEEYMDSFKPMWSRTPAAIHTLRALWQADATQARLMRYSELANKLETENTPVDLDNQRLIDKRMAAAKELFDLIVNPPPLSNDAVRQILAHR